MPGRSCSPIHSTTCFIKPELPRAVSATVTTIAVKRPTMAIRSESLVRRKPGGSWRCCPHIWLNASRKLAIQPSPAHAAAANPMIPTDVRDSIAESISSTNCWPRSPETVDLIFSVMSASRSGWRARTNPAIEKATISNGKSAKIVK